MTTPDLHDYQEVALQHLRANNRAGLFLDMGLGKTATVLSALEPRHLPMLVVAPKRVAQHVWPEEVKLWRPDLSIRVALGRPADRAAALASGADIVVIGRDVLEDAIPFAGQFNTFTLDELSGFKNWSSNRFKAARKIIQAKIKHVWGLTGTPAPQGLLDLWSQIFLLDGGVRLGTGIGAFRKDFFTAATRLPNGVVTKWDLQEGAAEKIHALIDDICISMKSDTRLDLPEIVDNDLIVPFTPTARRMYREMKRDYTTTLNGKTFYAPTAGAVSNKLSQILGGFIYDNDEEDGLGRGSGTYTIIHHEKVRALVEIADGTGSPLLVFYRYQAERDMIIDALGDRAHTIETEDLQNRWNAGEIPVLVAHPDSIGHGLNLQKGDGHTMVWYSLPWSLEAYEQSNKRLQRQGQRNTVIRHFIMTPRTVDYAVRSALEDKRSVEEALLAHLESPL